MPDTPPISEGSEPTLEQLERAAEALGFPLLPESLRPPHYEESLRNLHAIISKAIAGDEEAGAKLVALQGMFGRA
jgi:hypothetical protein